MNTTNSGGGGSRSRGRGGRGGRGGPRHRGNFKGTHRNNHTSHSNNTTSGEDAGARPLPELEVESVYIPHAFEASCAHVKRCRERGRLFHLPLTNRGATDFVVVERTIVGIDDVIYNQYREVWERLPRGNARVFVKESPGGERYRLVGAVNGLRKFGYNDSSYGYPDAVTTVVAIEKENGECGHISAFVLSPQDSNNNDNCSNGNDDEANTSNRYWIVGSKNAHIVLDYHISDTCLEYYSSLGRRYSYAIKIARLWKEMLPVAGTGGSASGTEAGRAVPRALTAAQALSFHTTLHERQWTGCFEAIFSDSQHLVDYDGANELRYYAITSNRRAFEAAERTDVGCDGAEAEGEVEEEVVDEGDDNGERKGDESNSGLPSSATAATAASHEPRKGPCYSREDGLCLPVKKAEAFYLSVGLPFSRHSDAVDYRSDEYARLIDTIGRRTNSEGCVMYGADAHGVVVRLWKEKSYPYVMERATREAITSRKLAGTHLADAMKKKLMQQQPELQVHFKDWEATRMPWLLHFAAWLQVTRRLTPSMRRDEIFPLRNRWLSLQKEFQRDMDRDPELYDVCGQYQPDPVQWGTDTENLDVIKFVGPQGCGKSTLSRALYELLLKVKYHPRWVNQDESGNRDKFLASLRQATHAEAGVTHLLIDKMNLDARTNRDYENLPLSLTVAWYHPDGESALYNVCVDRVLGRGSGHRTIRLDPNLSPQERAAEVRNIRSFIRKAVHACETPQDPSELVLELDITAPLPEMVRMIWDKLEENGRNSLPPITEDEIAEAIVLAHRYESLLCELPKAPVYACIALRQRDEVEKLLAVVHPDFTRGQVLQSEFHLTTKFFGGETDPVAFVTLAERLGQTVTLTLDTVVADPVGVAVTVRRDDARYPCANLIPHFTISNKKGVPPKYSNDLISESKYPGNPRTRRVVRLADGITVTGVFEFR